MDQIRKFDLCRVERFLRVPAFGASDLSALLGHAKRPGWDDVGRFVSINLFVEQGSYIEVVW